MRVAYSNDIKRRQLLTTSGTAVIGGMAVTKLPARAAAATPRI